MSPVTTQTGEMLTERRSMTMIVAGSMAEGIAGIGAIVLAILGLSHILPEIMLPIAAIAVGAAFLFEGGAATARFSSLLSAALSEERKDKNVREFGIGITTEFFTGVVGIVLGVLAILGVYPLILVPAAAIVFGSGLMLGSVMTARLNSLWVEATEKREIVREVTREALAASAGVQTLIGLGAVTLGILSIVGLNPLVLSLIAMLSIGFADLLSGSSIVGRFKSILQRHHQETV
jgi:hypothetical protein